MQRMVNDIVFVVLVVVASIGSTTTSVLVVVDSNGNDTGACLSPSPTMASPVPCKSLDYVLTQAAAYFENESVVIEVRYSHSLSSVDASLQGVSDLSINGLTSVVLNCSVNSAFKLFDAANLHIQNLVFQGCYNRGPSAYGLVFYNSLQVRLSNCAFTATGGVWMSNVTSILVEACNFTANNITSKSCKKAVMVSPLFVSDISVKTMAVIQESNFLQNTVEISCSPTNDANSFASGGILVALPRLAYPTCELRVDNNSFYDNMAISSAGAGAVVVATPYAISNISEVMMTLSNNSFHGNMLKNATSGSAGIYLNLKGCNEFMFSSMDNEFISNIGTNDLPGGFGLDAYKQQCQQKSNAEFNFLKDNFLRNSGNSAVTVFYSQGNSVVTNDRDGHQDYNICVLFSSCNFENNTATAGAGINVQSNLLVSNCHNESCPLVIVIDNCTFSGNTIRSNIDGALLQTSNVFTAAIVKMKHAQCRIMDSTIANNDGTGLELHHMTVSFSGRVSIINNTGVNGGGVRWKKAFYVNVAAGTLIEITGNTAAYGGALYFDYIDLSACSLTCNGSSNLTMCDATIYLLHNMATSDGHLLFMANPLPLLGQGRDCIKNQDDLLTMLVLPNPPNGTNQLASTAQYMQPSIDEGALCDVFPGQVLNVKITPLDWWMQETTCSALVYLLCGNKTLSTCGAGDPQIYIDGPVQQLLQPNDNSTSLRIVSEKGPFLQMPSLVLSCTYTATIIKLSITDCLYGFTYNPEERVCDCLNVTEDGVICSATLGKICIKDGLWYGLNPDDNTTLIVIECINAYCSTTYTKSKALALCPSEVNDNGDVTGYLLLTDNPDDQCIDQYGGFACSSCQDGYVFSLQAVQCLDEKTCTDWHSYILLILVVIYQFLLTFLLFISLKFSKMEVGSGYLYGPLFCIATSSSLINFSTCSHKFLDVIDSLNSLILLNPIALGYIPWCFFPGLNRLTNYALRYFVPVCTLTFVVLLALLAQKWSRCMFLLQQSPLKIICLLILLSFCSVTKTSLTLVIPFNMVGIGNRVRVQPDLGYFKGLHALYASIALVVLGLLVIPFTVLLLVTPFLQRRMNLAKVKPFVDEFYSCYQDRYRCYASVYFIAWITFSVSQLSFTAIQVELIALATMHFLIYPYSSRWLNRVDAILLLDLVVLSLLTGDQCYLVDNDTATMILTYAVTLVPYIYILLGVSYIIVHKAVASLSKPVMEKARKLLENFSSMDVRDSLEHSHHGYQNLEEDEDHRKKDAVYLELSCEGGEFQLEESHRLEEQ